MVNVEGSAVAVMATIGGAKVQTGAGVEVGVIALHESVTFPVYPLIGVTVTVPVAPLPACTLLGAKGVVTVRV